MAKLNTILSALYQTDSELFNKVKDIKGAVSGAFGDGSKIVVSKAGGIDKSAYSISNATPTTAVSSNILTETAVSSFVDAKINAIGGSSALTGFTDGNAISSTISNKNLTVGVKVDDKTIKVSGGVLSSTFYLESGSNDSYAAVYTLKDASGASHGTINIPKDQFLSDVTYLSSAPAGVEATSGKPALKFTFKLDREGDSTDSAKEVYVSLGDLVDTYTSGDGITVTSNSISISTTAKNGIAYTADKTEISGVVAPNNDYLSVGSTGFTFNDSALSTMVDNKIAANNTTKGLTGDDYENRLTAVENGTTGGLSGVAANTNVIIGSGVAHQVKSSDYTLGVGTFENSPTSSKLATELGVKTYTTDAIETAINASANKIVLGNDAHSTKDSGVAINSGTLANVDTSVPTDKVVSAAISAATSGKINVVGSSENEVPLFDANGQLVSSDKTIGGSTVANSGNANILATEAAVKAYADSKVSDAISGLTSGQVVVAKSATAVETTGYATGSDSRAAADFATDDKVLATEKAVDTYVTDGLDTLLALIGSSNASGLRKEIADLN